jgi:hypothetical protein
VFHLEDYNAKAVVEVGVDRADPQALVKDHGWLSRGRSDVVSAGLGVLQFTFNERNVIRTQAGFQLAPMAASAYLSGSFSLMRAERRIGERLWPEANWSW